jgi:hypothetical protein
MATDATGTPTSPDNIPTYNTAVDAPSGLGFNAAMAAIQTALNTRIATPAGILNGEIPVWNGSTWVRSSQFTGNTIGKVARGDGTWGTREIVAVQNTAVTAITATTEAGSNIVYDTGSRTYTTDTILLEAWGIVNAISGFTSGDSASAYFFDGGTSLGQVGFFVTDQAAHSEYFTYNVMARVTPTAGTHQYRLNFSKVGAGTWQSIAGAGGAGNYMPMGMRVSYV